MIGRRANVLSEREVARVPALDAASNVESREDLERLLMLQCGKSLMAVEMSHVARLEVIPANAIERSGSQEVVQYRGGIMPLVRIAPLLYGGTTTDKGSLADMEHVVVFSDGDSNVGLVVDNILDVVEEKLDIESRASRPGIFGSAVIQARVADILDVPSLVRAANPQWFARDRAA